MEYFYKFLSKHLRVLKIENDMIYLPNWRPVLGECFRRSLQSKCQVNISPVPTDCVW